MFSRHQTVRSASRAASYTHLDVYKRQTLDRESPNYIVEWQLIAEMLFETEALYRHLVPGKIWNEYEMAAAYIRKTIGQEEENEED